MLNSYYSVLQSAYKDSETILIDFSESEGILVAKTSCMKLSFIYLVQIPALVNVHTSMSVYT